MKKIKFLAIIINLLLIAIFSSCSSTKSTRSINNMVARLQVKEPIEGVCDNTNVIAILPFPGNGQVKAVAPKTKDELTVELNAKVVFLSDKPDYEDKGMVNLIINCKGNLVRCGIDNKTKSLELDNQIVTVFAAMKTWKVGAINSTPVDTSVLYSFTIKNGKISL